MSVKAKHVAAALAAVQLYVVHEQAALPRASEAPHPWAAGPSPWALAGRLAIMTARLGSLSHTRR